MNRKTVEIALRRRAGASPEARAKMLSAAEKATDWYTRCSACGAHLRGSLAELNEHARSHEPR